jgi:hypothetical protein
MKTAIAVGLAALFLLIAPIVMGHAQQANCGPHEKILAMLDKYGESSVGIGLASTGEVVELFLSEKGTFTILISSPQGVSCVASIGSTGRAR